MKLYPVDRDAFATALSVATVSTGYSDGCVAGSFVVSLAPQPARYVAAALADSLGVSVYEKLSPRPDPKTAGGRERTYTMTTLCVPASLRDKLVSALGTADVLLDHDTAMTLLGILALAMNVEIHRPDCC